MRFIHKKRQLLRIKEINYCKLIEILTVFLKLLNKGRLQVQSCSKFKQTIANIITTESYS